MTSEIPKLKLAASPGPQEAESEQRAKYRKLAEPKPRHQLVSIVRVVAAFNAVSGRLASIAEINDMLVNHFDCDNIVYRGIGYGLADAYDGSEVSADEHSGYHQRQHLILDLYNGRYWDRPDAVIHVRGDNCDPEELLMTRKYAKVLVHELWNRFGFDEDGAAFPEEAFLSLIAFDPSEKPSPLFNRERLQAKAAAEVAQAVSRWPWGAHHTEALGHLEAAAQRFWVNYDASDSSTAPTNDQVIEWLRSERGATQNMAEKIASILRADGLPSGPRR